MFENVLYLIFMKKKKGKKFLFLNTILRNKKSEIKTNIYKLVSPFFWVPFVISVKST
jgi:hypothetical protein